jgi:hypothetical protein
MLILRAMGLGGWVFDCIDRYTVLGASGDPEAPGLGFRYATDERRSLPNPTGPSGVLEGYRPPHFLDMRAAVEDFAERKFGPGGPFHPDTPGPWKESAWVCSSAQVHSEEFEECVAIMAQPIYGRFGKFPGTVLSIFVLTYLQANHLELEFYDHHFGAGAYLRTHAEHKSRWHREGGRGKGIKSLLGWARYFACLPILRAIKSALHRLLTHSLPAYPRSLLTAY